MLYDQPTEILSATMPAAPCEPLPVLRGSPALDAFRTPSLDAVRALQDRILASGHAATPPEPRHYFAPGQYGRELAIPGGMVVVGKQHRHAHLTLLLSGTATINTDRGMETITGPHVWVSTPGAKRALVTHTDCVFFTVHNNPTDTTDLEAIEAEHIIPEPAGALDDFHRNALQEAYA